MDIEATERLIYISLMRYRTYLRWWLGSFAIGAIATSLLLPRPALAGTLDVIPGVEGGIRSHYVSGNGTRVVFSSTGDPAGQNADGNRELFVYDVASKQIHQLTNTTSQPNFSDNTGALPNQDATRIVFSSRFNLAGGGELLSGRDLFLATVNYATTTPSVTFRRLTTDVGNAYYAYSGDGHVVGLIANYNPVGRNTSRDMQMYRINLDPAPATQQLTEVAGGIVDNLIWMGMDINFSGNRIVFTSSRNLLELNADGNQEIYYVTDTGRIGQVTQTPAGTYNRDPSFSAGSYFVFSSNADITGSNPDTNFELFVSAVDGGNTTQITDTLGGDDNFGGANKNPRFSQGADSVVFTSNRGFAGGSNADGDREIFQARITYSPFNVVFEQLTDTTNPHPGTRFENDYADIDDQGHVIAFNSDLNPGGLNGVLFVMQRASTMPTTPPYISYFLPRFGGPGVPVSIGGRRFTGTTSVLFGTLPAASFRVISDTYLVAVAPAGVTEAPITVTTPAGSTTTSTPFRLEQLTIGGEEFNQGMASYPAVAGKDALVRVLVHIQNNFGFGAWAISDATLTVTSPSGRTSTLDPRMYSMLIQNKDESLSEKNNINFFVPGSLLAESGLYTFRILAHTAGQTVVDRTFTKQLTATSDVVLIVQSMMRAPDEDEFRLLLQELDHFSRMHPVRAGIGGIRLIGDLPSDKGLRVGYVIPPMFSGSDGTDTLNGCATTTTSCWGTILQQMNELREAFNALGDYEPIEFGTVAMPHDRVISPQGEVQGCSTMHIADGYGNFPGNASWIRLCGINTTLAHEIGHNMGLIPNGAANSDGSGHSINSYLEGKPAFNLTRWEYVDFVMAAMCSPACGPDKNVFFEDEYNGQPVDYPWLVNKRQIVSGISMSAPLSLLALNDTVKSNATDVPAPLISMTRWNGPRLLISALINAKGVIRVHNLAPMPKGTYLSGHANKGKVELVLRDARGNVIQREYLATQTGLPADQEKTGSGEFYNVTAVRPMPGNTAAVEIVYRDKIIYRLKPGSKAPTIRVKTARLLKAGKGGVDKVLLEWKGSDTDGDALRYRIDYSRDGKGYIPLLLNVAISGVAIPIDQLPGGNNFRFRITASDGINTATVVTPRLSLPGHRPVAAITSLSEGERFLQYDTIELRGLAFDLEEGIVGSGKKLDKRFTWRLDNQRILGHGAVMKTRTDIAPGKHTVTLEFRDSDGDRASIHRRILVEADSDRDRRADHFERSRVGFDAFMPFDRSIVDAVGGMSAE